MNSELINLLKEFNDEFPLVFNDKDLNSYTQKLIDNSEILIELIDEKLAGFIAFYANNYIDKKAFLSMLIIHKDFRERGIASSLMARAINYLETHEFKTFELEVLKKNTKAIEFYFKNGFKELHENNNSLIMVMEL